MDMSEMKKKIREALPENLIADEAVLEKIAGGIQTGMTEGDLSMLLRDAGIVESTEAIRSLDAIVSVSKPKPGPMS